MKNQNEKSIFINQIGYLPEDKKVAFLTANAKSDFKKFELCDFETKNAVFEGEILSKTDDGSKYVDSAVGEEIFTADFSDFSGEGKFFVKIGNNESFPFFIKKDVYSNIYFSALNYFTLSRCGQGICHTGTAEIYGTNETKNVQGGWHDAGDYGRYVVPTAKTVMDLLLACEKNDSHVNFDILSEVRFALEWLLLMQREDGGVYHKISCYHFCAFIKPEDEKDKLVISPVSTAATADFAGCLAFASKFFKEKDSVFAEKLLNAALKAQEYLNHHDDELFINPPEISTGSYGDKNVSDERYFALCALWDATQNPDFLKKALKIRSEEKSKAEQNHNDFSKGHFWIEGFGWGIMSGYGTEILLKNSEKIAKLGENLNVSPDSIIKDLEKSVVLQAEKNLENSKKSSFKYCLGFYGWGSNGCVCDCAHVMLLGYKITGRKEFFKAAKAQVDYVLGCNPLNYCYVTGYGSKSPVHPHHRPSGATKKVMPGMLVGGPCAGLQDEYARCHLAQTPALKCYADAEPSYSTNEVAIYWNSAFIYVLSQVGF